MRVYWWRHKRTQTAHGFFEDVDRSLCLGVEMMDMGSKTTQGTMLRCRQCLKALARHKKQEALAKKRRSSWRAR